MIFECLIALMIALLVLDTILSVAIYNRLDDLGYVKINFGCGDEDDD